MPPNDPEDWLVSPRGPIRREGVAKADAFARWQAHRGRFAQTGLWPVILSADDLENLEQGFGDAAAGVEDDVAMGLNLDVREFFTGALEEMAEEYDDEFDMDFDFDPDGLTRKTPPVEPQIAILSSLSGKADREAWIALVPCRESWEVSAVLGYGGWNACPMPSVHVAVLREWHARHEAVPLVVSSDTIELLVRPIEDAEEAKRIAIEQYACCTDIVDQGTDTVEALASTLLGASVWFFWWD